MSILSWLGGSSTSFNDRNNWSPNVAPNSTSDVLVNPSVAVSIQSHDATINSLELNANATLTIDSTSAFTILGLSDAANPSGASQNAGTLALQKAADLYVDGQFTNSGTLQTTFGSDIWVHGSLTNSGAVAQGGDVTIGAGGKAGTVINGVGGAWAISGAVDMVSGAAASQLTNEGGMTRSGAGVTDIGVSTTNTGTVTDLSGRLEFLKAVSNTGTMSVETGSLWLDKNVSGVGALDIGGGALHLVSGSDAGQTVHFMGAGALDLHAPTTFGGTIAGFGAHDAIDLLGLSATGAAYSGGVLTISNGTTAVAHLNVSGSYSSSNFHVTSDTHGGTLVQYV